MTVGAITVTAQALSSRKRHDEPAKEWGLLLGHQWGLPTGHRWGLSHGHGHAWQRVTQWLLKRHKRITWAELYRRFLTARPGNRPQENGIVMFDAATVPITRYRWRGTNIPTPWTSTAATSVPA